MNVIKPVLIPGFRTTKPLGIERAIGIQIEQSACDKWMIFSSEEMFALLAQDNVVFIVLVLLCGVIVVFFFFFQEILQYGRSFEVEKILCNDRYQRLKVCW